MHAFDAFWYMDMRKFHSINVALVTLIPKMVEELLINILDPCFREVHLQCLGHQIAVKVDKLVYPS
jgi:hypothetical protein